jgi:hypothetical protein
MLFNNSIHAGTLELLNRLMTVPEFNDFCLVGDTALALQYGHRISYDLDMFSTNRFSTDDIQNMLYNAGIENIKLMSKSKSIITLNVNEIKVDFVNYRYPFLEKPKEVNGIRLAEPKDINAMKLAAITGRGRMRDFIDLFFLLQKFSLKDMICFYTQKYQDGSDFLVVRSLTFFDDAENDSDVTMIIPCNWNDVKNKIRKEVELLYK